MYGENTGHLRDALGTLLREHRIQQRLGGKGTHTVPETTTETQRIDLGNQIRRYRHAVLSWCLQAVGATNLAIERDATTTHSRAPAEELRYRLTETLAATTTELPTSQELLTAQEFATLESWRHAARAAALAEHDLTTPTDHSYGQLAKPERLTVLKDTADIVRGLVTLDRRYENIPGWEKLHDQGRLGRAAQTCAAYAGYDLPDYTVDTRGWHPPPRQLDQPHKPGLPGLVQAQYNLLVSLDHFPDAHTLRLVIDSQRLVSREAAARTTGGDPALAARWTARAETYDKVGRETRDLGGLLGTTRAASQASIAAYRARTLSPQPLRDPTSRRCLDRLFTRIDQRLCDTLEHGVAHRLYFLRVPYRRIDERTPSLVKGQPHHFVPITSPVQTDLLDLVRNQLRPKPARPRAPAGADKSRTDFQAAITHRPGDAGPNLSM